MRRGSIDAIDEYPTSHLAPRQKAALALADAMIWQPGSLPDDVVAAVRRHLTPSQATEVALDVMRNALNKVSVAMGTDAARISEGYEVYEITSDGRMRFA